MKFNTYIISLNKDKKKYKNLKLELSDMKMDSVKFTAITGKKVKRKDCKYLTKMGKSFLPDNLIGQGISHILLNKHIYEKDNNDFAVVLEDNVRILYGYRDIENIILTAPKDWEYISLNCKGICEYKKNNWNIDMNASMAGYIINKKGAKKIANIKLSTFIDIQINNEPLIIYKSPKKQIELNRFNNNTYNRRKVLGKNIINMLPKEKNMKSKVSHYLGFNLLRIPFINLNFNLLGIYLTNSIIIGLILMLIMGGSFLKRSLIFIFTLIILLITQIVLCQKIIKLKYKNKKN